MTPPTNEFSTASCIYTLSLHKMASAKRRLFRTNDTTSIPRHTTIPSTHTLSTPCAAVTVGCVCFVSCVRMNGSVCCTFCSTLSSLVIVSPFTSSCSLCPPAASFVSRKELEISSIFNVCFPTETCSDTCFGSAR